MTITCAEEFQVKISLFSPKISLTRASSLGKQAVLVLHCDNIGMSDDVMVEPGLVMIFAHGIE